MYILNKSPTYHICSVSTERAPPDPRRTTCRLAIEQDMSSLNEVPVLVLAFNILYAWTSLVEMVVVTPARVKADA